MLKKLFVIVAIFFFCVLAKAQENPQYSHFLFNKLAYNPAFAGGKDVATLQALYRQQWQNIVGAPRTANVQFHTPFAQQRCGAGIMITQDQLGLLNNTFVDIMYAYRLKTSTTGVLSIGLQARMEFARMNWEKAKTTTGVDNYLQLENETASKPNFGLGVYYKERNFFAGFSVPQMLESTLYKGTYENLPSIKRLRTYYFMTGGEVRISEKMDLLPGMLVSYVPNAPFEVEWNANLIFSKLILVGLSYRVGDSIDGLIGVQLNRQLRMGLSYDYTLTKLRSQNIGSFEGMLEYQFVYDKIGVSHLRYF